MRSFLVMAMFIASFANAGWRDYSEVRDLQLDADGIEAMSLSVGAGSLDVTGVAGSEKIIVTATITVPDADEEGARKIISKEMKLELDSKGDEATLKAWFDQGFWGQGSNATIDLDVKVPEDIVIRIDDGSGSIDVTGLNAAVRIDDGSGSIDVQGSGPVNIDDGSGSIDVAQANGDVKINDGSGSITVKDVTGSVYIDDGSGSIKVDNVQQDLVIIDNGSGSLSYANVQGRVEGDI